MAQSLIDRAWRATTPDEIEPDLAALWREVGQQRRVARAVLSNLVVVRERPAARAGDAVNADEIVKDLTLDEVVARHPSRVILIQHNPATQTACAPSAVSVGIITFGPPHARYGVEQIVVQAACAEQSLPSIIRRLLRGDVPTSALWTDDLSEAPPLDGIVAMPRQFPYDSGSWGRVVGAAHRSRSASRTRGRQTPWLRSCAISATTPACATRSRRCSRDFQGSSPPQRTRRTQRIKPTGLTPPCPRCPPLWRGSNETSSALQHQLDLSDLGANLIERRAIDRDLSGFLDQPAAGPDGLGRGLVGFT